MITQDELKKNVFYEPETGMFTRISNGNFCETKNGSGYIVIKIKRKLYDAHRLAFLYMTGSIPDEVDHKNCIRDDNSWSNLRPASHLENTQNRYESINNTSGFKGVHWHKNKKKWHANIRFNNKKIFLGSFNTAEEASKAYNEAAEKYHKEFAKF